jgi:two-component system NtrC family sensor kinase
MEGEGCLTLATERCDGTVRISISDTGCGIPNDLVPRIFDPFFTTKEPGKGTGLGLSIAYQIITNYGGTIRVESKPGQGTRFIIQLPIKRTITKEAYK